MPIPSSAPRRAPPDPPRPPGRRRFSDSATGRPKGAETGSSELLRALWVERALSRGLAELNGASGAAQVFEASRVALGQIAAAVPGSVAVEVVLDGDRSVPDGQQPRLGPTSGITVLPAWTSARLRARLARGGSVAEGQEAAGLARLLELPPTATPIRLGPVAVADGCPMVLVLAGRAAGLAAAVDALGGLARAAGAALQRTDDSSALATREARMRAFVECASDIVLATDRADRLIYASPSVAAFLGHQLPLLNPVGAGVVIHSDDIEALRTTMAETRQRPGPGSPVDCRLRGGDGAWHMFDVVSTNLLDDPNAGVMVLTMRDITDRLELEDQLRHQAFHDPLTGLANRILLKDRLDHALVGRIRAGRQVVLLALDLDDFKQVNDTLGHAVGDEVLLEVTRRIKSCLRPEDTFARIGGDEFAILLEEAPGTSAGELLAERIRSVLTDQIRLASGAQVQAASSVGIASSERHSRSAAGLLRDADIALYAAKTGGKGRHVVYQALHNKRVHSPESPEADLAGGRTGRRGPGGASAT